MYTLLLNSSYEPLTFISLRNCVKLFFKGKAEAIAHWDEIMHGNIKLPAILKMNYFIKRAPATTKFNSGAIFKRDQFQCQYCGISLSPSKLTMDHVIPKSKGGQKTFTNIVSSCFECNGKKRNRTPEEAGMVLLNIPTAPKYGLSTEYILIQDKHEDWGAYFPDVKK